MHLVKLSLYYKDKISFKNFLNCIQRIVKNKKIGVISNITHEKSKISRFTPLKSPHVNKRAQEHYQSKIHKVCIIIFLSDPEIFYYLLKKVISKIIPPIKYKINMCINSNIKSSDIIKQKKLYFNFFKYKKYRNYKRSTYNYLNYFYHKGFTNNKVHTFFSFG